MTPEATDIANDIADVGQTALLRRLAPHGIHYDVTLKAVERSYTLRELTPQIAQGDREVRISNREILDRQWPGPPRRGDQIWLQELLCQVMGVEVVLIKDEVVMHIIQARGP